MSIERDNNFWGWLVAAVVIVVCLWLMLAEMAGAGVLYFTQNGCTPCQQMKPVIASLQQDGYGVKVHNISSDSWARQLYQQYNVRGTPTTILVDAKGREQKRWVGAVSKATIVEHLGEPAQQDWIKWEWTKPAPHHKAAVRINGGSGVYVVLPDGTRGILTAAHVGSSPIHWSDGTVTEEPGESLQCKFGHDVKFVQATNGNIDPLQVAAEGPKIGDELEVLAFGGPKIAENKLRHYRARVESFRYDDVMVLDCAVVAGDSGGCVLNARHEVVSVVSAGDAGTWRDGEDRAHPKMLVPRWTPVRDFIARVIERLGGRQAPPPGMRPAPRFGDGKQHWYPPDPQPELPDPRPPQPSPDQIGEAEPPPVEFPQQPLEPDCDCEDEVAGLSERLDQIAGRLDGLAADSEPSEAEGVSPVDAPAGWGLGTWLAGVAGVTGPLGLLVAGGTAIGYRRLKRRVAERLAGGQGGPPQEQGFRIAA